MRNSRAYGRELGPLEYDMPDTPHKGGVDAIERFGRRGELHYLAAVDGIDPADMVAWADTEAVHKPDPGVPGMEKDHGN